MQNYQIIIVADDEFVSDKVKAAWLKTGITLLGPVAPGDLQDETLRRCGGLLMDLSLDASVLFDLSERLERFDIPFLFIVTGEAAAAQAQPYRVTADPGDIATIAQALAREGRDEKTRSLH